MSEIAPIEDKETKPSKKAAEPEENILKLKNPIKIDGERVSEIAYDFEELTAADLIKADKLSAGASEMKTAMIEFDNSYHLQVFIQAVLKKNPNYDESDIERLKGKDAVKAIRLGRVFLIGTEDGEDET